MKYELDPRTSQFKEVMRFVIFSIVVHLIVLLIGKINMVLISLGYVFFASVVLPFGAIVLVLILRSKLRWHWGQVLLASIVSLILGFFQFVIVAAALPSV